MLAGSVTDQSGPHVAVCLDKSRVYGAGVLEGLADYMEVHGPWSVFLEPFGNGTLPWRRLDGWTGQGILALLCSEHSARRAAQLRIPIVDLCGNLPQEELAELGIPCVTSDHRAIGRLAAEHLVENGYAHFAFSGYRGLSWVDDRWFGFSDAIAPAQSSRNEYTLPPARIGESIRSLQRWEEAQQRLADWLQRLPTPVGIMACNDAHAVDLLDACRRAKLDVPDAVAIVGVDNDEALCRLTKPELSSIIPNPRGVGYEAARLLDELMHGRMPRGEAPRVLISPRGAVTRLSTQGTAVPDDVIARALRHIREQAPHGINVEEVLRQTGLSRRAFYQRFQNVVGRTPHEEICRVRLGRVKRLLQETDLSLEKVAELTGYCSAAHLSVSFRRDTGMPPGEFRRRDIRPI